MSLGAFAVVIVIASPLFAAAQPPQPTLASVLKKLDTTDWQVRAQAVEQLTEDPEMFRAPATRRALVQLLDRENKGTLWDLRQQPLSEAEGEAYRAHYDRVLDAVFSFAGSGDVQSVSVLVQSSYNGDSPLALKLATYGQTVVPALLERAGDRRHSDVRPEAYEVLGRVLQQHRLGLSRHMLTRQAVRDVENCLRAGLRDPSPSVRMLAIRGVIAAGDVASIPILEQLRRSDPWVSLGTTNFSIRGQAAEAIAAIQANPLSK